VARDILDWLDPEYGWLELRAIDMMDAKRRIGDQHYRATRTDLLSSALSTKELGAAVRSHSSIENDVHWILDVIFDDDQSQMRQGSAAEIVVVSRHLALNQLCQKPRKPRSITCKRLKAS
jgi:predicted transposase YbfD/YdcC